MKTPDTIVLIHGMWMTPRSWRHWVRHYEQRGYRVLAPAWPGLEVEVEALRADPAPLARLTTREAIDHYESIIRALPSPPILIGHSFGGAIMQALLERGLGAVGIGLHSAFVKGVYRLPLRTLRSTWRIALNPLNARRAPGFTKREFHYAFASTVSRAESDRIYDELHVPAAGRMFFEGITANFRPSSALAVTRDKHERAPLLLVGSPHDNLLPLSMQRANARLYRHSRAITELLVTPGRSHNTVGQDGWESVADALLAWAIEHAHREARAAAVPSLQLGVQPAH